eukprot:m.192027 g.192027  ORF g.192027 m.192027 type:complete len:52 (-) comp16762_c10_seq8:1916-2071(-)
MSICPVNSSGVGFGREQSVISRRLRHVPVSYLERIELFCALFFFFFHFRFH